MSDTWVVPATASAGTYTVQGTILDASGNVMSSGGTSFTVTVAPVNGLVGSDEGQDFAALSPIDPNLCAAGTPGAFTSGATGWTWHCFGVNGGTTDNSGIAYLIINGQVGSDTNRRFTALAATDPNLCAVGTVSGFATTTSGWTWSCAGSSGGTTDTSGVAFRTVNGLVGSDEGKDFSALLKIDPNLCASGTPSGFAANATGWTWNCLGLYGGTTDHSGVAYLIVNGVVGSDKGQTFSSLSATDPNLCAVGTVSGFTAGSTGWTWSCAGLNGGTTDRSGTASLVGNGLAGSDKGRNFAALPATDPNLCAVGTVSGFTASASGWTWSCVGVGGGTTDNTGFAYLIINGQVGSDKGRGLSSLSSTDPNLCSAGTVTGFNASANGWAWGCAGVHGGTTDTSGIAYLSVNGQAGTDKGERLTALSATDPNLCAVGTVGAFVVGTSNWTWSCVGLYGGTTDTSGIAYLITNGLVGSDKGKTLTSLAYNDPNLCAAGTVSAFAAGTTGWSWACVGLYGGTTDSSGIAYLIVNGLVGSDKGQYLTALTSSDPNLCVTPTGVVNFVASATGWTWGCAGLHGGTTDNSGVAYLVVNGLVGTDKGKDLGSLSATDTHLCASGTVSAFATASTSWTWSCAGINGGTTDTSGVAYLMFNGQVGSDKGKTVSTLSATDPNLCVAPSTVVNFTATSTGWTWGCAGINGGTTDSSGTASNHTQATTHPVGAGGAVSSQFYSCVRNWYVDTNAANASDATNGRIADVAGHSSLGNPFKTISRVTGDSNLQAGDCIQVNPGVYNETVGLYGHWNGSTNVNFPGATNSLTGYVTLVSTVPLGAHIVSPPNSYVNVQLGINYVAIDGFDISGVLLDPNYAYISGNNTSNPRLASIGNSGGCIASGSEHHIIIINNTVHNCGLGGIEMTQGEFYTIENNEAWSNALTNAAAGSGISIWEPRVLSYTPTSADYTTYHNIVAYNIAHDNIELYPQVPAADHTDGNGIVLDDFQNFETGYNVIYPYQTLVYANVAYGNGSKGLQIYASNYLTVANNVSYDNNIDVYNNGTWRGELNNSTGNNNIFVNNIGWSLPGSSVLSYNTAIGSFQNSGSVWYNNLTFDGTVGQASIATQNSSTIYPTTNLLGVNPQFVNASAHNFQLQTGSPAIGAGLNQTQASALGLSLPFLPVSAAVNIGPY